MKVLLVANYAGDAQWSMDRFSRMLERGLAAEGVEVEVIRPDVKLGGGNKWLGYVDKFLLFRGALKRAVMERSGWVIHILDQGNGIWAGWIPGCVVTCHDLLAIRAADGEFPPVEPDSALKLFKRQFLQESPGYRPGWSGKILQRLILHGLRKAKGLASVSEATRRDAERYIGPSEMIPNGLEDFWQPIDHAEAQALIVKAGVPEGGYLLHVGGSQWYKNRAEVMQTLKLLRESNRAAPRLVMVGPPPGGMMPAVLKEAGLWENVTVLTGVSDETLRALYNMAAALVFPSIAEGFGWPILEAQACGCPVVTTLNPPMRDTGGNGAIFTSGTLMLPAVASALGMDEAQRATLVAAGMENARRFTVKAMARGYIEFYRRHAQ